MWHKNAHKLNIVLTQKNWTFLTHLRDVMVRSSNLYGVPPPSLPPDTGPKKKKKKSKAAQHKSIPYGVCVCSIHLLIATIYLSLSFFLFLYSVLVYCSLFSLSFLPYLFHNHVFVFPFLILSFLQYFSFILCLQNTISWSL